MPAESMEYIVGKIFSVSQWREAKVLFHSIGHPIQTGRSLRLIWRRTLDSMPFFTLNRSVRQAIPDYFGANQWCRTLFFSRNGNHSLLIISKKSQLVIQFFHYRLPLFPVKLRAVSRVNIVAKSNKFPFPMILVWDWKRVNVARYSVEDHLIGWWVGRRTHFVSGRQTVGHPREHPGKIGRGLFTPFLGGWMYILSVGPMKWKIALA